MQKTTTAIVAIVAGLIIGFAAYNFLNQGAVGGTSNFDTIEVTGLKVGTSGTTLSGINMGSCELIGTNVSQAASSTKPYDCAVTGIVSTDDVFAQLGTTTLLSSGARNWNIVASGASSTAGYLTVLLFNGGPAVAPSSLSVGSSTTYLILR